MNTISNNQNKINMYPRIGQANTVQNDNNELRFKQEQDKKQYGDSIEISNQAARNPFANVLNNLVSSGTITSEQESAISSAIQAGRSMQAKGVYSSKNVNPLDSLVSSGTITEEQETAIQSALEKSRPAPPPPPAEAQDEIRNLLEVLVTGGTITSDQLTSIENAFENSISSGEPEEGSNPMQDLLASLVKTGTITDTQSSAIQNALESGAQEV